MNSTNTAATYFISPARENEMSSRDTYPSRELDMRQNLIALRQVPSPAPPALRENYQPSAWFSSSGRKAEGKSMVKTSLCLWQGGAFGSNSISYFTNIQCSHSTCPCIHILTVKGKIASPSRSCCMGGQREGLGGGGVWRLDVISKKGFLGDNYFRILRNNLIFVLPSSQ